MLGGEGITAYKQFSTIDAVFLDETEAWTDPVGARYLSVFTDKWDRVLYASKTSNDQEEYK